MSDTNSQKIISKIYDHFRASGCRFSTDSREVFSSCGGVFFALSGGRFDGNNFAAAAIDNGATLAVVDRADVVPVGAAMLDHRFCSSSHNSAYYALVDDVLGAMQQVARMYRREFDAGLGRNMPVIGLTGTNGKTTTKELLVRVLGTKYRVGATVGNLNNHIGVPTTLLSMPVGGGAVCDGCSTDVSQVEVCVVEMGANHVGEIAELCAIAEPNIGLVTNVGCAHIEGFGSEQGVRQAKGELYDYLLRTGGRVVFRADDKVLCEMVEAAGSAAVSAHTAAPAAVSASASGYCAASLGIGRVWSDDHGFLVFEHQGNTVSTHLVGEYNIYNVMAAMALGQQLGVETAVAVTAVAGYVPENNRSQRIDGARGNVIFMDAYNANPSSMELALENFGRLSISGVSGGASIYGGVLGGGSGAYGASVFRDKVLILGDMRELGAASSGAHRRILEQAMRLDVGRVFVVGDEMQRAVADSDFPFSSPYSSVVSAADVASASKDRLFVFDDVEQLCRFLDAHPLCSSTILVKGSRGVGLEKVMAWL